MNDFTTTTARKELTLEGAALLLTAYPEGPPFGIGRPEYDVWRQARRMLRDEALRVIKELV